MISIFSNKNIVILIICYCLSIIQLNAQKKFKVGDNGINGLYSAVIKSSKQSKPKLVNIYIYEYIQYNSEIKFLCQIEQYQTKRAKGLPRIYQYYGYASGQGNGVYKMYATVGLGSSRPKNEISELKLLPNGKFEIKGKQSYSSYVSSITGTYEKKSVRDVDFDAFLTSFYGKMIAFDKPYRGEDNIANWGTASATQKRSYNNRQKKLKAVNLTTSFENIEDFHNNETITVTYNDDFTAFYGTRIEYLNDMLGQALNYSKQTNKNPLIYHFPYLKNIKAKNSKTGEITHIIDVQRDFRKFRFKVKPTTSGLADIKNEKRNKQLAEEAKIQKEKEKRLALLELKAKKDKKDAELGYNPSGVILDIEKKPRGLRNKAGEILFGKEYNDAINTLNERLSQMLNSTKKINVIDTEKYFKNIFYGNFSDLKPEKVSKGLMGSNNHFPEFHNAFLFYAYQELGKNYYPNMTTVKFEIITTQIKKDSWGNEVSRFDIETPYEIAVPKAFSSMFMSYLNKGQFSWSGEDFNREFEYLMLSFFERYPSDSLVFKQMVQNLHRYSKGEKPAMHKSELVN